MPSSVSFTDRLHAYLADLHDVLGDERRRARFDACRTGPSLNLERKSVEPMAYRLYLPGSWAEDSERRGAVGMPEGSDAGTPRRQRSVSMRKAARHCSTMSSAMPSGPLPVQPASRTTPFASTTSPSRNDAYRPM